MAVVDTVYWLPIGGPVVEVGWLGPQVGAAMLYSSHEQSELLQWLAMMAALETFGDAIA